MKEPLTVTFEKTGEMKSVEHFQKNILDLLVMMSLPVNQGKFSASREGALTKAQTPYGNYDPQTDAVYKNRMQISGTYVNGMFEGEWTYDMEVVTYPSNVKSGSAVSKTLHGSGTIQSDMPVTTGKTPATIEGSYTDVFDSYSLRGTETAFETKTHTQDFKNELTLKASSGEAGQAEEEQSAEGSQEDQGAGTSEESRTILPGINGIGDIPGPDSPLEAVAGLLVPGIIGILGGLIMGGGAGLAEPPASEPPATEPSDDGRVPPAVDPATRNARDLLDMFDKRAHIDRQPDVWKIVNDARKDAFDPNGNLIPEKWAEVNSKLRDAISEHAGEPGEVSIVREHIDGVINSAEQVKDVTGELLTGAGDALRKGFGGVADGIMNPADFFRGVREGVLDWSHKNTEDWRKFGTDVSQSFEKEGPGSALQVITENLVNSEKKLWGGIWETGKEFLPVEELKSFFDENASLEERLWAVPAAASKIAGLLVGTELVGARVPGLGDTTLIPSQRAAAAAAEEAAASSVTRATEAKAATSPGIGDTAKAPGAAPKAAAGTEAAAKEAEKSAARLAEDIKGDKARAAAEQRFSDPAQRAGYQSEYQQYMDNAQKKADAVADTIKSGKAPDAGQALDNMSDPAAMRDLKSAPAEVRKGFIETQNKIFEPTNREVESFLSEKYPGEEIKVESVRTPGKNYDPTTSINTDNDVHAVRKVIGKDGSVSWKEVPSEEWKQAYHDSFAKNSNFTVDSAKGRFPEVDWDHMTPEQQTRRWGELHQQEPGDVFDTTSGRDFRKTSQGGTGLSPDDSAHAAAKRGEGKLTDAEQLGMMEREKFTREWNKGTIPHQKEALEQLSKKGREVESLIEGYQKHSQVSELSPKMKSALKIIEDNNLSPLDRAQKVKDLGFSGGPQEVSDQLSSKIESLKIAKPK